MGELRFLVTDAARAAFTEIRETHPDETFYGYCLSVRADTPAITAHANGEQALRRTAERLAADGYGSADVLAADAPGSLRWRTGSWEYRDIGRGHFDDAAAAASAITADAEPDEAVQAIAREVVGACRDLNREDFFGWGPERDAVVVLIETGDPDDLLEYARDVNPATPFARLQTALA